VEISSPNMRLLLAVKELIDFRFTNSKRNAVNPFYPVNPVKRKKTKKKTVIAQIIEIN
jgi:hypothetical protein